MAPRSLGEARSNFEQAAGIVSDRYAKGVQRADWATAAASDSAEKNYGTAIARAVSNKSRQKGVAAVSNASWQAAAATKGAPIIGDRMRQAAGKYEQKFGPVYQAIVSAVNSLPARTLDYNANIDTRLKPVVRAAKTAAGKA